MADAFRSSLASRVHSQPDSGWRTARTPLFHIFERTSFARGVHDFEPTPLAAALEPAAPLGRDDPDHVRKRPGARPSPLLHGEEAEPHGLADRILNRGAADTRAGRDLAERAIALAVRAHFVRDHLECGGFSDREPSGEPRRQRARIGQPAATLPGAGPVVLGRPRDAQDKLPRAADRMSLDVTRASRLQDCRRRPFCPFPDDTRGTKGLPTGFLAVRRMPRPPYRYLGVGVGPGGGD